MDVKAISFFFKAGMKYKDLSLEIHMIINKELVKIEHDFQPTQSHRLS